MVAARFSSGIKFPRLRVSAEAVSIFKLMALFWLCFQIFYFLFHELDARAGPVSLERLLAKFADYIVLPFELALVGVGFVLTTGTYLVLRHLRRLPLWEQMLAAAGCGLVMAGMFMLAVALFCQTLVQFCPQFTLRLWLVESLKVFPAFGLWAAMALTVSYNSEKRERERKMALLQAQAQDAQMRALRYQVNPHLLYNTLNSIAALILDNKNVLAEQMVLKLSDFFRASLSSDPHADVPLADEVALQRLYIEIEQIRFPDRLSSEFDIAPALEKVLVPSLILQPLIENSLKHAVHPDGSPTHLRVQARQRGRQVIVEVTDNGPGRSAAPGTGIGLANVRERLITRFGDKAGLETESIAGRGFLVRLRLPAVHA